MNIDTGEIKNFLPEEKIPEGWQELKQGSVVKIGECYFQLKKVDTHFQELILKPVSKIVGLRLLSIEIKEKINKIEKSQWQSS